jgi:hypothetical protein
MAVRIYVSNTSFTLNDVAKNLNDKYHFSPPLSYDSIGRWVESQGLMKTKEQQCHNRWVKRKEKYGPKGFSSKKIRKLSEWRTNLWADPEYRKTMSRAMSHPKRTVLAEEAFLHT